MAPSVLFLSVVWYRSLRLTTLPKSGGDTLWASGYEIYDRFSKPYQKFLESLTATFIGDGFIKAAKEDPEKVKIYDAPRGSPLNVGKELKAVHPVVSRLIQQACIAKSHHQSAGSHQPGDGLEECLRFGALP